jgi:hypothetical protein
MEIHTGGCVGSFAMFCLSENGGYTYIQGGSHFGVAAAMFGSGGSLPKKAQLVYYSYR